MERRTISKLTKHFEEYAYEEEGIEFARELQFLLGYTEWRNFLKVVEKAKESCKTADNAVSDHGVNRMVAMP
jgi:DNA-damage-inducible protein D